MTISNELKEKINIYLKSSPQLKERILNGDVDAIRELCHLSQQGIDPLDVIESYENNTMDYLYKKAKLMIGLQELYHDLLLAHAEEKIDDAPKKHI